ncbi:GNAT family N-acetyltransferase [Muricauda sp. HICW]|uniref:GNAT family N-acetyltransferase n=1 Tax=Flagellimonas chongwuensis TaxID=2697365 RepID=A0A850NFZ2_9FLAO|nr:GNAT family N-acetyltransferase [Allomuricauda chongwuensis]NVN19004.1 GNAT family N-acetyltransferase [Allomuricauda chongwuensis]
MSKYLLENQTSERLIFRKLKESDFEEWLPFYHNPTSTQYWEGLPTDPIEACRSQFDRVFERYENDLGGMNALISKETGQLVGICGLLVQVVDDITELEIGYSVLPQFWLKGYAYEAAQKCKHFAFENHYTDSLISIIHVDNLPSQKVALKNGMYLDKTTTYKNNPVHIFRVNAG